MRDELAELKKDYSAIEAGADEALNEFSSEMDDMNQQVCDLQAVIKTQDDEIKELHTLKPRGLSKVMDAAAQSAPAPAAPVATAQTAAKQELQQLQQHFQQSRQPQQTKQNHIQQGAAVHPYPQTMYTKPSVQKIHHSQSTKS